MAANASKNSECAIQGCEGKVVQMDNLFLHTLGADKKKPDFSEFIECEVWRCTRCGNIQLYGADIPIRVPRGR